jgi:SAM-dependent methyltransferase
VNAGVPSVEQKALYSPPQEQTIGGLHDFLIRGVLARYATPGGRAVDLGAGSGALIERLLAFGLDVLAVDVKQNQFNPSTRFVCLNLNDPNFALHLGQGAFDLVTAVEVIEHLESPIAFLRNVRCLLAPDGVAVITTPNVENAPARMRFLLSGKIRMMDERGDLTHISPIFLDLLHRQYLPRAEVQLREHYVYPPRGYKVTRLHYRSVLRALGRILSGQALEGDNHILVLSRG